MSPGSREQKNRFKQIFRDGWEDFKRAHPRYAPIDPVVQQMLGCGAPANGYAVYLCPNCHQRHVVAFSCKSQLCRSCAKAYGQNWVETVQAMLHPGVKYRHLTLTVPDLLRPLCYQHPATRSEWNDPFADQLSPTEREMLGLDHTNPHFEIGAAISRSPQALAVGAVTLCEITSAAGRP